MALSKYIAPHSFRLQAVISRLRVFLCLQSNFGVGGFGYPALVAFKPSNKKFSTAKGAFEVAHVQEVRPRWRATFPGRAGQVSHKCTLFHISRAALPFCCAQFIERIRRGGESVSNLNGDLASIKTIAPWVSLGQQLSAMVKLSEVRKRAYVQCAHTFALCHP